MPMSHSQLVMRSHKTIHWPTPQNLYAQLDEEFHFTMDPCPLRGNEDGLWKGAVDDGLAKDWNGEHVFVNPPYGRDIGKWLAKAREADLAVYLLPARTDTQWWHQYALNADEVRFIRGRMKFGDSKTPAPFPSVLLIFRKSRERFR